MPLLDPTFNAKVHKKDNGDTLVIESGGQIILMPGAKMGPSGATVALPIASASQAVAAQTQTALTDSTGGAVSTTLAAGITDTVAKNAIASLAAELALVKADVAALVTLTNALRSALVSAGTIKGSA